MNGLDGGEGVEEVSATGLEIGEAKPQAMGPAARWNLGYICVAVVVAIVAVWFASRPIEWLVGYCPDDAFYYLQIARHIAHGDGVTFDGINPTNGFHPGWMVIMSLCALVAHSPDALLRLAIVISFALHIVGSTFLTAFLRRVTDTSVGTLLGAAWLVGSYGLQLSLMCMESMLAIACVAAVLWFRVWMHDAGRAGERPPFMKLVILGALLAMATYARTDLAIFGALTILTLIVPWRFLPSDESPPGLPTRLRHVGIVIAVWTACMVPWLVVSHAIVGTVVQDSAAMKRLWYTNLAQGLPLTVMARHVAYVFFGPWIAAPILQSVGDNTGNVKDLLWAYPAVIAVLVGVGWKTSHANVAARVSLWIGGYIVLAGLAFGLSVDTIQAWHSAVCAALMFSVAGIWLYSIVARVPNRNAMLTALGVVLVLSPLLSAKFLASDQAFYPWQRDVYKSQPEFEQLIPSNAKIGCFNAGIPAYFSDHQVINLDGLVNHSVVSYWQGHKLDVYIRESKIAYIADDSPTLTIAATYMTDGLALLPVAQYPLTGMPAPGRTLYKVVDMPAGAGSK